MVQVSAESKNGFKFENLKPFSANESNRPCRAFGGVRLVGKPKLSEMAGALAPALVPVNLELLIQPTVIAPCNRLKILVTQIAHVWRQCEVKLSSL